jgi:hypothetical protein
VLLEVGWLLNIWLLNIWLLNVVVGRGRAGRE